MGKTCHFDEIAGVADNKIEQSLLAPSPRLDLSKASNHRRLSSLRSWSSHQLLRSSDFIQNNAGIHVAILSGILLTLYSYVWKTIKDDISRGSVLVLRGLIQSLFFAFLALRRRNICKSLNKLSFQVIFLTLVVALMAGLRLCLIFTGLQLAPMAVVHSILNGSPVLVMLLAHFMLKDDKCSLMKMGASVLFLAGMALVFQPHRVLLGVDSKLLLGLVFSLMALLLSATGAVLTKMVTRTVDKLCLTSLIGVFIATVGIASSFLDSFVIHNENIDNNEQDGPKHLPSNPVIWAKAFIVAIVGASQQFCLIAAIARDRPSRVTMARSSQVIFSFLLQLGALPHEQIDLDQMIGAGLILCAIICVAIEADKKRILIDDKFVDNKNNVELINHVEPEEKELVKPIVRQQAVTLLVEDESRRR